MAYLESLVTEKWNESWRKCGVTAAEKLMKINSISEEKRRLFSKRGKTAKLIVTLQPVSLLPGYRVGCRPSRSDSGGEILREGGWLFDDKCRWNDWKLFNTVWLNTAAKININENGMLQCQKSSHKIQLCQPYINLSQKWENIAGWRNISSRLFSASAHGWNMSCWLWNKSESSGCRRRPQK